MEQPIYLPPEAKIHMALDDIIKVEQVGKGISGPTNLFKRPFNKYRPRRFFRRRHFRSQNWRLRRNGPHPYRYKSKVRQHLENKWAASNAARLAFIRRMQATTASNSVFQRLGNNPGRKRNFQLAWSVSRNKVYHARHRMPYAQMRTAQPQFEDLDIDTSADQPNVPVKPLTKINLAQLREVLGGQITRVSEAATENGELITQIIRVPNQSFDTKSESNFSINGSGLNPNFNPRMTPMHSQSDSDIINDLNNGRGTFSAASANNTMNTIVQNQLAMGNIPGNQFGNSTGNRILMHGFNKVLANSGGSFPFGGNQNLLPGNQNIMAGNQNIMTGNRNFMASNQNPMTGNHNQMAGAGMNPMVWEPTNNMSRFNPGNNQGFMNLTSSTNVMGPQSLHNQNISRQNMQTNSNADRQSLSSMSPPIMISCNPSSSNFNTPFMPHSAGLIQSRFRNGPDMDV